MTTKTLPTAVRTRDADGVATITINGIVNPVFGTPFERIVGGKKAELPAAVFFEREDGTYGYSGMITNPKQLASGLPRRIIVAVTEG